MIEMVRGPVLLQQDGDYLVEYSFKMTEKRPKRLPRGLKLSWAAANPNLGLVGQPAPLDGDGAVTLRVPIPATSEKYRIFLWDNNRPTEAPLWQDEWTLTTGGGSPTIAR